MTTGMNPLPSEFISYIPVRNIWLLLLYASKLYRELPASRRVEMESMPDHIPHLVAEILTKAVERRLRRELSHGYQRRRADINRVRGRIDLFRTERRQLLQRGSVACVFDELTVDTQRNRYVKAALVHIAGVVEKFGDHLELERRCRDLAFRLERAGVVGGLDAQHKRTAEAMDNVGWADAHERQMLAAARLALNLSIPSEQSGLALLPIVNRSETKGWKVSKGDHIYWPATDPTPGLQAIMPGMITDIVLQRHKVGIPGGGRRIVIDTKFTSILGSARYEKQTLKSANMYQMYTYLRSQELPGDPISRQSTGVLLYPSLGVDYNESAIIQGHRVSFATVDLAADGQTIRSQLLRIVDN